MTKRINFKNTVTLVAKLAADSAGLNEKRALNNLHVEIKPLLRRRICLYGKAVVEASAIAIAARLNLRHYGSQYIDQIIACANAEAEALDMDSSHIIVKHSPAKAETPAKVVRLSLVETGNEIAEDTPPNLDVTDVAFMPLKVANEIGTLANEKSAHRNALLIYAFSDAVNGDKPVYGETAALELTNKWLALADTTIKNDVPLLRAIKEKIVEVHLAYIRLIKKGY